MIIDFRLARELKLPSDIVVIVGAGAAGISLALSLAGSGVQVVLIESGGNLTAPDAMTESADLNDGLTEGQRWAGLRDGRARVLGGATQLWMGQCMRLNEHALREREWIEGSGWPIKLTDLEKYYVQAENWLDLSGRGYSAERWLEHPALTPIRWNEERLVHHFGEYCPEPQLGTKHRKRLVAHPNIRLIVHATAGCILHEKGQIRGVEVRDRSGRRSVVSARCVALCAGAVENTRLLKMSDPAGVGLGAGREHTGHYLQDHPIICTAEVIPYDYRYIQDRYVILRRDGHRVLPKVRLSPLAQERYGLLDAAAVFDHVYDTPAIRAAHRLRAKQWDRPWDALTDAAKASGAALPFVRGVYRRYIRGVSFLGIQPSHVWLHVWVEQPPESTRTIMLSNERDALGLPKPIVRWNCGPAEIETTRQLTRWIADDLTRLGIARVRELPAMTNDDSWLATVRDGFHLAGTTRMSNTPETGVVDLDLQVHGLEGLYVVGGSVFPCSSYAHPTLTIIALAFRLADCLRDRWMRVDSGAQARSFQDC